MKHDEVGCYFQILELKKIGLNLITGTHMLLIQANPPWLGARLAQRIKNLASGQMMEQILTETYCPRLSQCRAKQKENKALDHSDEPLCPVLPPLSYVPIFLELLYPSIHPEFQSPSGKPGYSVLPHF